ncbi:putative bifunctional diguanylate cyclase/phosphodiesterase [Saccharopolyspora griseoalba]|uniref:Bifunctional diguanylate cyclase/phosphodiesterase n=1 Tax=Saccharopolyspora griseoalba TaxID=1431848 RepID=A0ABW2LPG0_9PSEU
MGFSDEAIGAAGGSRLQRALAQRSGAADVAVFTLDREGRVNSWNPDAEQLEGYPADEVLGRHFSMFYPESDRDYPSVELANAAEAGVHVTEGWRVHRDGTRFWAYVVLAAQRDQRGEVIGFIKVVRDDTASHLRQERSAKRFSDLLDLAPVGIGLIDEAGRLYEVNEELAELIGVPRADLVGVPVVDLLHPEDDPGALASGAVGDAEPHTLVGPDGRSVTCEVSQVISVQDDGRRFRLVVFQDVTSRVREAEMLQYQATHDPQTGLLNRRGIDELLGEATADTAVLLCDLDNFKRINDAFGRAGGDEVIAQVARNLSDAKLPGCTVARLAGDEFLIVCPNVADAGGLAALADEASGVLSMIATVRGMPVQVTASIGAAMPPSGGVAGDDLLRYADAARYQAKERGHQKVVLATDTSAEELNERVRLEADLAVALRTDGLELYYQPIVDATGAPLTAEALVRWPHPCRGVLSPAVIMPLVEQIGLVEELDRWVLRTALKQAAAWPEAPSGPIRVSINLSPSAAGSPEFLHSVADALSEREFPPSRLMLEVTEIALVELSPATLLAMRHLIELGVHFAIDDFGAGYSSLARLKNLPAATIKLDRQFVAGIEDHEVDRAIVRSTVDMAHATDRRCVVEGVETEVQFRMLEALDVDAFQGFLFSRPLTNGDFETYLRTPPGQR